MSIASVSRAVAAAIAAALAASAVTVALAQGAAESSWQGSDNDLPVRSAPGRFSSGRSSQ